MDATKFTALFRLYMLIYKLLFKATGCAFTCKNNPDKFFDELLHPFNGLFSRTTWVSRYQKPKISLDLNERRDDGVLKCIGISWTIRKQSAPHSRQITTPTAHRSDWMLFLTPNQCQSTEGKLIN